MIENHKFENAKKHLFLEDIYPLLHETTKEKIDDIMLNGLNLKKSYHGEITRVVAFPKNEEEFKNYHYYFDKSNKTILVIGIPKIILGDIPINTPNAYLLLNCITEYQKPDPIHPSKGFQFHELKFQKLPSIIPLKWILGYFDENSDFFPNPSHIITQENSDELINSSKADILSEFHRRYPGIYLQLFDDKQNNTSNVETKEK